jgi:hypothetical protein
VKRVVWILLAAIGAAIVLSYVLSVMRAEASLPLT